MNSPHFSVEYIQQRNRLTSVLRLCMSIPHLLVARTRILSLALIISAGVVKVGSAEPVNALPLPSAKLALIGVFDQPVDIASRANDTGLYIVQQSGRIVRLGPTGTRTVTLDLTSLVSTGGEQGLLGLVFHPTGKSIFVNYTDVNGNTVVARYAMKLDGTAVKSSRVVLFTLRQPYANHNGGGLAFGPNGRLFIGTGDGGSGGDPERRALDPKSRLGKMISLNPNAASQAGNGAVIWSRGLRNPWRFEFDSKGNLWIADVGQNAWEEVNLARASNGFGKNKSFGWSALEANARYNTDQPATGHQPPVFAYQHGNTECSISGGTRIRDTKLVSLKDWYVFGDYCSGDVTAIWVEGSKTTKEVSLLRNVGSITAIRTVNGGAAFVLTHGGKIYRIVK
ncbi:MAG: PQQ-dependent sugar dehydrogenase [Ilumatobacteraceae bacterium]